MPGVASAAYISRIESGARNPSVKALRVLATKLDVSAHFLETGEEIPPPALESFTLEELFGEIKRRLSGQRITIEITGQQGWRVLTLE